MCRDEKQYPECLGNDASTELEKPEVLPPVSAEDFLHAALEKTDLKGIVRILRDWYGRKEIKKVLGGLHHRDPVDQFTHIRRHAVELYAIQHGLKATPLMVKLTGRYERKDPERSEREKLENAREFVNQNDNALIAARALAEAWGKDIPKGMNPDVHLEKLNRTMNILSPKPTPEV
jgi:hypothetical protein